MNRLSIVFIGLGMASAGAFLVGLVKTRSVVFWSKNKSVQQLFVYLVAAAVFLLLAFGGVFVHNGYLKTLSKSNNTASSGQNASSAKTIKVDQVLTDGYYAIGTDLPAGTYNFTALNGSGNIIVLGGPINAVIGEESVHKAVPAVPTSYSNAKLTDGQTLWVTGVTVKINSSDASGAPLKHLSQPKLQTKRLSPGSYTIGAEIPPGLYDFKAVSGNGMATAANGIYSIFAPMGTDNTANVYSKTYQNVPLKQGTTLKVSDVTIEIVPVK